MTLSKATQEELLDQLERWLQAQEGERLEFKEAKGRYSFEDLAKYSCALANEGGGRIILGVTDKRPRRVVGTQAFPQPEDKRRALMQQIPVRIDVVEIPHPAGRTLVFEVAARPLGTPLKFQGIYWSRQADSLVPMSEDKLRSIFAETGRDFSAEVCPGTGMEHLDTQAIEEFRRRWIEKSGKSALSGLSHEQLLRDAELLLTDGLTYAALILFGTRAALGRFLAQAEVVFEYRSTDAAGPAADRKEYRQGFFSYYDELWQVINLRNDRQHYQDGLFVWDIPSFDERSVREAVLNAVAHRDYQLSGSVFVRQYPRRLAIESPGGFPPGITVENILDWQAPRNRRIAEAFQRCGLVERSGQGMNLIFEQSIRQGKPKPDFTGTDAYHVVLTLHGQVQDPAFVRFLERIGQETQVNFDVHDLLLLERIHREEPISEELRPRVRRMVDLGVVETVGRGRGTRYLLARRFYQMAGSTGAYTRRKGLDRETNKALLTKHVQDNAKLGVTLGDFCQVLPHLSKASVQGLVRQLKREGKIRLEGNTKAGRWYPADASEKGNGS